jgi:hypothetical protein
MPHLSSLPHPYLILTSLSHPPRRCHACSLDSLLLPLTLLLALVLKYLAMLHWTLDPDPFSPFQSQCCSVVLDNLAMHLMLLKDGIQGISQVLCLSTVFPCKVLPLSTKPEVP